MDNPAEFDKEAQRLNQDLDAVSGQIKLCRSLMKSSPGLEKGDEALKDLIGFLEACADRMGDLIEAGANGLLTEETFARCFLLNDALQKTLEAERTGTVPDDGFGEEEEGSSGNGGDSLVDIGTPTSAALQSSSASADVLALSSSSGGMGTEVVGIPMTVSDADPATVASSNPFDNMQNVAAAEAVTSVGEVSTPVTSPPPVPAPAPTAAAADTEGLDNFLSSLSVTATSGPGGADALPPAPTADASRDVPLTEVAVDDVNSFFESLEQK